MSGGIQIMSMRIETLEKSDIGSMADHELHALRNSFAQIYTKFGDEKSWPGVPKDVFITKYAHLTHEMDSRGILAKFGSLDAAVFQKKADSILNGEPEETEQSFDKAIKIIPITKADDDPEQIVMGIVAEPNELDTDEDWQTEDDIREALYSFMEQGAIFKMNHKGSDIGATLLEAFIAPVNFAIEGQDVKKGSWVQALRVDDDTWEQIENGELTGFSMAGTAIRIEDEAA